MSEQKSAEEMVGVKPAEQWAEESGYSNEHDLEVWKAEVAHRKAIQLDAYTAGRIAGMLEAAEIAKQESCTNATCSSVKHHTAYNISQAILTAAQKAREM
jgi:hypothetical protein